MDPNKNQLLEMMIPSVLFCFVLVVAVTDLDKLKLQLRSHLWLGWIGLKGDCWAQAGVCALFYYEHQCFGDLAQVNMVYMLRMVRSEILKSVRNGVKHTGMETYRYTV